MDGKNFLREQITPTTATRADDLTFDLQRFSKKSTVNSDLFSNGGRYWVEHEGKLKYIINKEWQPLDEEYESWGLSSAEEVNKPIATLQSSGTNNETWKLTDTTKYGKVIVDAINNVSGGYLDESEQALIGASIRNYTTIDASEATSKLYIRLKNSGNTVKKILGGTNDDELIAGDGGVSIDGGAGNDTLYGYTGDDYLDGGAGDDLLIGGGGADTFAYSGGNDTIDGYLSADNPNDTGEKKDTVILSSDDIAAPTSFDNIKQVDSNLVLAFSENNSLTFKDASAVEITKGNDTFAYTATSIGKKGEGITLAANHANVFDGSGTNYQTIDASAVTTAISIKGNDEDNVIIAGTEGGTLDGGAGADSLVGATGKADVFVASAGTDTISGYEAGTDIIEFTNTPTIEVDGDNVKFTDGSNVVVLEGVRGENISVKIGDTEKTYSPVAQIGEGKFYTLSDALTTGGTIQLLVDVEENISVSDTATIDLNGKTFAGDITVASGGNLTLSDSEITGKVTGSVTVDGGTLSITGGIFNSDLSEYVDENTEYEFLDGTKLYVGAEQVAKMIAEEAKFTMSLDGKTSYYSHKVDKPVNAVASIGGNKFYTTLENALSFAESGDTIKLLKDAEETAINISDKVSIDLNGKVLYKKNADTNSALISISAGGELNLIDSAGGGAVESYYFDAIQNSGVFNMRGGKIVTRYNAVQNLAGAKQTKIFSGSIIGKTGIKMLAGLLNVIGGKIRGFYTKDTTELNNLFSKTETIEGGGQNAQGGVTDPPIFMPNVAENANWVEPAADDDSAEKVVGIDIAPTGDVEVIIGGDENGNKSKKTASDIEISGTDFALSIGNDSDSTTKTTLYGGKFSSEGEGSNAIDYQSKKEDDQLVVNGAIVENPINVVEGATVGGKGTDSNVVISSIAVKDEAKNKMAEDTSTSTQAVAKLLTDEPSSFNGGQYDFVGEETEFYAVKATGSSAGGANVVEPATGEQETYYGSLLDAINSTEVADGATITLLKDAEIKSDAISISKSITIDFGGYKIETTLPVPLSVTTGTLTFQNASADDLTGWGVEVASGASVANDYGVVKLVPSSGTTTTLFSNFADGMGNLGDSATLVYEKNESPTDGILRYDDSLQLSGIGNGKGISVGGGNFSLTANNFSADGIAVGLGGNYNFELVSLSGATASVTTFTGSGVADNITNYIESVSINGGAGDDSITNYASKLLITGGAGADSIINSAASVTIDGGADADYISNSGTEVSIVGGAGADSIYNTAASVTIGGDDGDDSIVNSGSTVSIDGGAGADFISINGSAISITGGAGNDTFYYAGGTATVSDFASGDLVSLTGDDGIIAPTDGASLTASDGKFTIQFNNEGTNKLTFNDSAVVNIGDYIYTKDAILNSDKTSATLRADITGSFDATTAQYSSLESIDGSAVTAAVKITGNDLNNYIKSGKEGGSLDGGAGDDTLVGTENKADTFIYSGGADSISGYGEGDSLKLAAGFSPILDGSKLDILDGGFKLNFDNSNSITFSGTTPVSLTSDAGTYIYTATSIVSGTDKVTLVKDFTTASAFNAGTFTTIDASAVTQSGGISINGGTGDSYIIGSDKGTSITGKGTIYGGSQADFISVSGGTVYGGGGADTIFASGAAYIDGGAGSNIISLGAADATVDVKDGSDVISIASDVNSFSVSGFTNDDTFTFGKAVGSIYAVAEVGSTDSMLAVSFGAEEIVSISGLKLEGGNLGSSWSLSSDGTATFASILSDASNVTAEGTFNGYSITGAENKSVVFKGTITRTDTEIQLGGIQSTSGIKVEDKNVSLTAANFGENGATVTSADGYTFHLLAGNDYSGKSFTGLADTVNTIYNHGDNVSISGGSDKDTLVNVEGKNVTLNGGAGADSLVGGSGNALLIGGAGKDTFVYSAGLDTIQGVESDDSVTTTQTLFTDGNKLTSNGDNFTLNFDDTNKLTFTDTTSVKIGNYTYTKDAIISGKAASLGADATNFAATVSPYNQLVSIDGSAAKTAISISGNALANYIVGSSVVAGSLFGGAGRDTLQAGTVGAYLDGGDNNDYLIGADGNDTFVFNGGNDTIQSFTADADTIILSGFDPITDGAKLESLDGGFKLNFDNSNSLTFKGISAKIGDYTYTATSIVSSDGVTLGAAYKESTLEVDDAINNIDATAISNAISIKGGNNASSINGSDAGSSLIGGAGNDSLVGRSGKTDKFVYTAGSDTIEGYDSSDTVILDSEVLTPPTDFASISSSNGNFVLGFNATDSLTFKATSELQITKDTDIYYYTPNSIQKNTEAISLGAEYGSTFNGTLEAYEKIATIDASKVERTIRITGNDEANYIVASSIYGGTVLGGEGEDTLVAGSIGAYLDGGDDNDLLIGGNGNDTFVFTGGSDSISGYNEGDIVTMNSRDFSPADATVTTSGDNLIMNFGSTDSLTFEEGADSTISLVSGNNLYVLTKNTIALDKSITLTNGYDSETFTAGNYETVDASAVTNAISIAGNDQGNYIIGSETKSNSLDGGAGDDTLVGGSIGGESDVFFYSEGKDVFENFDSKEDKLSIGDKLGSIKSAKSGNGRLSFTINNKNTLNFRNDEDDIEKVSLVNESGEDNGYLTKDGVVDSDGKLKLFDGAKGRIDLAAEETYNSGVVSVNAEAVRYQSVTVVGGASDSNTLNINFRDKNKKKDGFEYTGGNVSITGFESGYDRLNLGEYAMTGFSVSSNDVLISVSSGENVAGVISLAGAKNSEVLIHDADSRGNSYAKMVFYDTGILHDRSKNPTSATLTASPNYYLATNNPTIKKITLTNGVNSPIAITAGDKNNTTVDASAASSGVSLSGGKKNDKLIGSAQNDTFIFTAGKDVIEGYASGDSINIGDTKLEGAKITTGKNYVKFKFTSKNVLTVKGEVDTLNINGSDYRFGKNAIIEGNTTASLTSGASGSFKTAKLGVAEINGGLVAKKNLTLIGTTAAESLIGGGAKTTLKGGGGADNLVGGTGADTFFYAKNTTGEATVANFDFSKDRFKIANGTITEIESVAGGGVRFHMNNGRKDNPEIGWMNLTTDSSEQTINAGSVLIKANNTYYWFAQENYTDDEGTELAKVGDLVTSADRISATTAKASGYSIIDLNYSTNLVRSDVAIKLSDYTFTNGGPTKK